MLSFYAGAAADERVAAWKQAARAQLANAIPRASYAIVLLDLLGAFERVPWWRVVCNAQRYGYNMWLLRLSIAVHQLVRTLYCDGLCSPPCAPPGRLRAADAHGCGPFWVAYALSKRPRPWISGPASP